RRLRSDRRGQLVERCCVESGRQPRKESEMDRKNVWCVLGLALALALGTAAVAEQHGEEAANEEMQAMMAAWQKAMTPGEPHAALARAAGSWKATSKMWMDPEGEPMVSSGSSKRQMTLGGRILEEKYTGDMMGQTFHGVGRTGYDNVTGEYWATWTDSMSTGVYVQHGTAGEDGSVTYQGEFVDPMSGNTTKVRSVVRWVDENTQVFEWHEDRGEGEIQTMEITYTRQAS
ncbi:MAG: DUF1579 domain-containing protein, partial [Gemmatimonadetes bacterium]|nr:DUF1579 domain-containing protein [Gemmatimonadota bacterium]